MPKWIILSAIKMQQKKNSANKNIIHLKQFYHTKAVQTILKFIWIIGFFFPVSIQHIQPLDIIDRIIKN